MRERVEGASARGERQQLLHTQTRQKKGLAFLRAGSQVTSLCPTHSFPSLRTGSRLARLVTQPATEESLPLAAHHPPRVRNLPPHALAHIPSVRHTKTIP
jgi:hypothetical protein